jgi:5'(3')-deoxyribonucleotidase
VRVSRADGFILGVDLDGVCGDYTAALRDVVIERTGADPASLPLERSWDFREWGLSVTQFEHLHQAAVLEHRIFRTMPSMPGVAETLWRLSDAGVWIRIITHRLYVNWGHATAVADTVDWLDAAGIPYRDLCFLGAKPQVEADCYVEDAPHNVAALRG